jgi:hypothetical protein
MTWKPGLLWSHGPLTQWRSLRLLIGWPRVRSPHGARNIWPHRLMARILAFQAEGDGSEPSGATARWCNGNMPAS